MTTIVSPNVVLASTSRYRRELLRRILPAFRTENPLVDESPRPAETPLALAERLARAKADAVPGDENTLVIGSDQVAEYRGRLLPKPGSSEAALEQLLHCRGQEIHFFTAVCVRSAGGAAGSRAHIDDTVVRFREFSDELARRYVAWDEPGACAGGFKIESAGPVLFDEVRSADPTALIGLPLIWLASALESLGVELLGAPDLSSHGPATQRSVR